MKSVNIWNEAITEILFYVIPRVSACGGYRRQVKSTWSTTHSSSKYRRRALPMCFAWWIATLDSLTALSMCWAPSFGAEAYAFAGEHHEICLWGRESDDRMRNEVIVRGTEDHVKSMVVTDRYIVAVPEQRKRAYVYSHTGERLRILDEGLDANEYFSDYTDEGWGGFVYSMQIVALGNFLFSSSMKGFLNS